MKTTTAYRGNTGTDSFSGCARVYAEMGSCSSTSTMPDLLLRLHRCVHKEPQQDLKGFQKIERKDRFAWIFPLFFLKVHMQHKLFETIVKKKNKGDFSVILVITERAKFEVVLFKDLQSRRDISVFLQPFKLGTGYISNDLWLWLSNTWMKF